MKKVSQIKASSKITTGKSPGKPSLANKAPREIKVKEPEPVIGLIQGRKAGSSYEWNVAVALWMLNWPFEYQVPIRGGREVRGGQVLDFVVQTVPEETVIRVQGEYWHRNEQLEQLKYNQIMQAMGRSVRILDMKRSEAGTPEAAYNYLLQKLGRN